MVKSALNKYQHNNRKLRTWTACTGSGYYDNDSSPEHSSCGGAGKERYKPDNEEILDERN